MTQKFKIAYSVSMKTGCFSEKDLEHAPKGTRLCDEFAYIPITYLESRNGANFILESFNGNEIDSEMSTENLFNLWMILGDKLSKRKGVTQKQNEILKWPASCFNVYSQKSS